MKSPFIGGWLLIGTLIFFVFIIGVLGPRKAYDRCLAKGGEHTVGRDMLCFDKEGRLVK